MRSLESIKTGASRLSWLFAGVLVASAVVAFSHQFARESLPTSHSPRKMVKESEPKLVSGPWGTLAVNYFPLQNSETLFYDREQRLTSGQWRFEGTNLARLQSSIGSLIRPDDLKSEVTNSDNWKLDGTNFVFQPSHTFIKALTPESRSAIYPLLASVKGNYSHQWPFRFTEKTFQERFERSGLCRSKVRQIRDLCYLDCNLVSFCDLSCVQHQFDESSFREVLRVLYSIPSLRVRLQVTPRDSITNLLAYWGKNQSASRLKPILETLAASRDGDEMNISLLLPPFARDRLYGYPDPKILEAEVKMDCFFTGMNFFKETPDLTFLDNQNVKLRLQTHYKPVGHSPVFGDLMVMINSEGEAIHMAVFIADDIVFTKNGMTPLQPWTLMHIEDMMTYFPTRTPSKIYFVREVEGKRSITWRPVNAVRGLFAPAQESLFN